MIKLFTRYLSIGVINTALHWVCFGTLVYFFMVSQATANVVAFFIAVTFSFFANAKWTFQSSVTKGKYVAFTVFMGSMAGLTGYVADLVAAPPIITLIAFSGFSLIAGFIFSNFIIFRDKK